MQKDNTTKLNVTLPPDLIRKIKDGKYNRNQLILSLLEKHVKKTKK
jgi:hypothetical protein